MLALTVAAPAQATGQPSFREERASSPSSVDLPLSSDPETIASLMAEVSSAAQLSEVEILSSTGVTARHAGRKVFEGGVKAGTWYEGSIDTSGNSLLRSARYLGEPLDLFDYWFDQQGLSLYSIDLRNPDERAAFKLLRDPKIRLVSSTSENPEAEPEWRRIMPLHPWTNFFSDPEGGITNRAGRAGNSAGTLYTFEQYREPYLVTPRTVTVEVDNRGRITLIESAEKTASYTWAYSYTSEPIRTPASNTWVSQERFTLAQEAAELMRIAGILKSGVLQDLKWTLSKESIVESVSRHVEDYNEEVPSSPFRWRSEPSGARFWTVSPLDGKNIGARFTLSKTGKLIVRSF